MKYCKFLFLSLLISALTCENLLAQSITDSVNPVRLEGVGVTWTRPSGEELFSVSNVNREAIENNLGNGSVNNLFDQIPSMVTTSDAGTGLGDTYMRIRGIDQTRINVTINGIALNDAESQGSWFVNLPCIGANVGNLEVQRGVGTSNNGSAAFGATMNFSTLSPSEKPFFSLSSAAGSFYTFRNTIAAGTGLINQRFSAAVSYSNVQSRGYIDRADAHLHSFFFTAKYRFLSHKVNKDFGSLSFNMLYGKIKTGLAWNGVPSDSLATNRRYNSCGEYHDASGTHYYENNIDNYQQTHFQLFYNYDKNINQHNRISFDICGHITPGSGYYEEYQENQYWADYDLPNLQIGGDTIAFGDLVTQKWLHNYFYGMTFHLKQSISSYTNTKNRSHLLQSFIWSLGGAINRYDGENYGKVVHRQYSPLIAPYQWYYGIGDKSQINIYGTFEYMLSNDLMAYVDLQYRTIGYLIDGTDMVKKDIYQKYRWHFFNPKFGVNYSWENQKKTVKNAVYMSFAMANREPTRDDLIAAPKDNRPVPETLYDVELGYRLKANHFSCQANGYFMYYNNQLVLTGEINEVGASIMTNAKQSFRTGLELVFAYRPVRFFEWKMNGTFSLNKILNYTEYVDDWTTGEQRVRYLGTTNISFSPNIIAGNEFNFYPVKDLYIGLITKFVGKQYVDNSSLDQYQIKPYCVTDLSLRYELHTRPIPTLAFFFRVNNLFNKQYESNAWLYRYYENGVECYMDGYFPQAGINFMGGIEIKF